MVEPAKTARFVCLAMFQEREEAPIVLTLEAVIATNFGTYRYEP